MRIIVFPALLLLSIPSTHAQLVKMLHQAFEVPDSATTLAFSIYENDKFEIVPWAGNTIMTESNIKLYYASRGVFDFFLEKGRYNFQAQEGGDTLVLAAQDTKRLAIKSGDTQCYEEVAIRIFIPDDFSQISPGVWFRPRKEKSKERIGAFKPRKKLARESGTVSESLRDAVQPLAPPADTLEAQPALMLPDSTWRRQPSGAGQPPKDGKNGQ